MGWNSNEDRQLIKDVNAGKKPSKIVINDHKTENSIGYRIGYLKAVDNKLTKQMKKEPNVDELISFIHVCRQKCESDCQNHYPPQS
ncbi:MAG: hypothetical protein JNL74_07915 [Fibrobacteres bacterium]|nr:hypothetical protein [Fibrobacterota bacterium]